jgi:glycosyltransferase involved in cell wall biosynthesis
MKSMENNLLISIDFRSGQGGIARVARLISRSMSFSAVFSLHGKGTERGVHYFDSSRILLILAAIRYAFKHRPHLMVFDHLNVARLLFLIPNSHLSKVVVFLHDEEAWVKATGLRRMALKKTNYILCNSRFTKERFLQSNPEFIAKTKVCLPAGVPASFSEAFTQENIGKREWFNDSRPYLLFVSRLWRAHRYKGYIELLEAFKDHYKDSPDAYIRLAIVGRGDDSAEVQRIISEANLSEHVSLFTDVEDKELPIFYNNSFALFFPSTREGFGMVYLEAMYFKKACIGIAGQPVEEIIEDGITGRLLSDNLPATLFSIIKDIEKRPEVYVRYGESGKKVYLANFTDAHFKDRFLNAINE